MNTTIDEAIIRIDATLPTLATREELHREIGAQTWKVVSWATVMGGALTAAVYFIATHVRSP